jgi:hypothetical protein
MRMTLFLGAVLALGMSLIGTLLGLSLASAREVRAQPGGLDGASPEDIVGAWLVRLDPGDPRAERSLVTIFHADGSVIDAALSPRGQATTTPGMGSWESTADHTYASTSITLQRDPNGNETTVRVRVAHTLNATNDGLSSRYTAEVFDASGNLLVTHTGTAEATRIGVLPME